jgi:hypothetical protein
MDQSYAVEVVLLRDDGQAEIDGRRRDQCVGEPHRPGDSSFPTGEDKAGPLAHDRLAHRNRIDRLCKAQRVPPTGSNRTVCRTQDTEFELSDRHNRDGHLRWESAECSPDLVGDEDRRIEQSSRSSPHSSSSV